MQSIKSLIKLRPFNTVIDKLTNSRIYPKASPATHKGAAAEPDSVDDESTESSTAAPYRFISDELSAKAAVLDESSPAPPSCCHRTGPFTITFYCILYKLYCYCIFFVSSRSSSPGFSPIKPNIYYFALSLSLSFTLVLFFKFVVTHAEVRQLFSPYTTTINNANNKQLTTTDRCAHKQQLKRVKI